MTRPAPLVPAGGRAVCFDGDGVGDAGVPSTSAGDDAASGAAGGGEGDGGEVGVDASVESGTALEASDGCGRAGARAGDHRGDRCDGAGDTMGCDEAGVLVRRNRSRTARRLIPDFSLGCAGVLRTLYHDADGRAAASATRRVTLVSLD